MVRIFKVTWMTFSYNLQTPGGEGLWAAGKPSAVGEHGLCLSKDDYMPVVGGTPHSGPPCWPWRPGPCPGGGLFLLAP